MSNEVYKLQVNKMEDSGHYYHCDGCYHPFIDNGVSITYRTFEQFVNEQIAIKTNLRLILCQFCKDKLKNELNSIV